MALEQADQALRRRRAELPQADPLNLISLALRNGFACLALAIGFAALGQRRRSPGPLLMEWQQGLDRLRLRRRSPGPGTPNQQLSGYMEEIRRGDSSKR